jgi:hypothetical protein
MTERGTGGGKQTCVPMALFKLGLDKLHAVLWISYTTRLLS